MAGASGSPVDVALFAFHLGQLWWLLGDLDTAQKHAEQALDVARAAGSTTWSAYALYILASLAHERSDVNTAGALYREALGMAWTNNDRLCVRMALPGLAGLAVLEGDSARALRLAGAAQAIRDRVGGGAPPESMRARDPRGIVSEKLGEKEAAAAWAEGLKMTYEAAMAEGGKED